MLKKSDQPPQAHRSKPPRSGWFRLPDGLLDEMVAFGTLGASLGGLAGSFVEAPGFCMIAGAQLGFLFTVLKFILFVDRSA